MESEARPALGQLIALTCLILVLAGCSGETAVRDLGTRAVVIGIDSADWTIIEGLAAEGGMRNLMSLRERGVWGPIDTIHEMPLSPVIWTSVATGKSPAKHGISWFMVDRPDGTRVPVRSHNRKVKAIWNILGEGGRRPTVLGWWATYPAEDVGEGAMISDALGFHGFGSTARDGDDARKTHPSALYSEIQPLMPDEVEIDARYASRYIHMSPEEYGRLMFDPDRGTQHDPYNPIHLFQQYAVTAEGYTSIAEKLLAERPFDLFMVYFEQVDSFSHLFMKYAAPQLPWVSDEPHARFRDVVSEWYEHQDELLGRLLAQIDLDETAVFIVSDHGFKSGERRIRSEVTVDIKKAHLDHESQGVILAAGPHIRRNSQVEGASVLDITPTLLHYLGFPVAEDMDGRVLSDLFEPDFLESNSIRRVKTYEDVTEDTDEDDSEEYSEEETAANLAALKALGYLGGSSAKESGVAPGDESSPEMHTNLGRIHLAGGDLDSARKEFAAALELNPNHADALLAIGEVYRLEGRLSQAEHVVKRALQVDPNSIGALAQLAELERDQNDLDEAIRLFREALSIDDSHPFLYLGLGDVLQRAGRLDEAERAFRSVLELDPDSFKAYYNLGVTYANQNRPDEAVNAYEKALELAPNHPEAGKVHNNLGAIHQAKGEIDEAAARYEQAVAVSPFHLESRYNLAVIYLARDRVDEAIELLEDAAALQPNHEIVMTRLGFAYLRQGRNEEGYRSLLLVRRLYPANWEATLGLAALAAASGQEEQARGLLNDALRLGGDAARRQAASYQALEELL